MYNLITKFDFFGTTSQFTTFKNKNFKTVGGGLYFISWGIIMITFCYLFGRDLFLKKNPKLISQITIPENYSDPFKLTPENFVFAWRLSDDYSKTVDYSGIIYPSLKYFRQVFNSSGQYLVEEKSLEVTKCTRQNAKAPEFYNKHDIDDWLCLDFDKYDNLTLGGFWDGQFVNYLQVSLYACENESAFSGKANCTDYEHLNNFLMKNNSIYIDFLFPEYYFDVDDQTTPFKTSYKSYYYQLDLNIRKTDRLFFKKGQLKDDQGWILSSINELSIYGFAEINDEIYINDPNNFGRENLSSKLYEIIIYTQKKFDNFQRSYMKVQDLSALIGGFMKFLLIFGKSFSLIFNNLIKDELIYYQIFDFNFQKEKLELEKKNKVKENINKIHTTKHLEKTEKINYNKEFSFENLKHASRNYLNSSSLMEINKVDIFPKKNISLKNLSTKISPIKMKEKNKQFNLPQLKTTKHKITTPNINNSQNFGLWFSFTRTYCSHFRIFRKSRKDKMYLLASKYLNTRLDIVYYLKTLEIVDKIKNILFNPYQNLCFEFMKYHNLENEEEYEVLSCELNKKCESNFNSLIDYFAQKFRKNEMNEIDNKLLEFVTPQIRYLIS